MGKQRKSLQPTRAATSKPLVKNDSNQKSPVTGSKDQNFSLRLLGQVLETTFIHGSDRDEKSNMALDFIAAAMAEIAPRDEIEGMLAAQMVATHNASMECLRRAMLPDQPLPGYQANLKYAHKLFSLYQQQLAALDKHRGKGQQQVVVKHVNVEPGGQAVVGHVDVGSRRHVEGPDNGLSGPLGPANSFEEPSNTSCRETKPPRPRQRKAPSE